MTRVRIASDLHFEFMRDHGAAMAAELTADSAYDVLVVAGDLTSYKGLYDALVLLAEAVQGKDVVYVLGNHEAYGATWTGAMAQARLAEAICPNLHVLEQETATIGGRRFVGCTLWFPHPPYPERDDQSLGDFHYILDIYQFLPETAKASAAFLAKTIQPGDIVVTHHLPHPKSVHPRYKKSPLNRFFLHDVSETVEQKEAALWVHGHTHTSCDYTAGKTRVVCNPFGYAINGGPGEPNSQFSVLTIDC